MIAHQILPNASKTYLNMKNLNDVLISKFHALRNSPNLKKTIQWAVKV